MKTKFNYLSIVLLGVFTIFTSTQIDAQETAPVKSGWSFLVEPYAMFPNMSGTVGLGNLPDVTTDISSSDIFSKLQMGAMLYAEASNEKWKVSSDLLYMNLAQGVKGNSIINSGEVSAKQLGWEVAGLYKVTPSLQFGVGILLNSIEAGVDINRNIIGGETTNTKKEDTNTWVDPMLVAIYTNQPGKKFIYKLHGEVGGFGLGSETNFAWQMEACAGYRFSDLFQIQGGYRIIGLDYQKGSDSDRFLYDMDTKGPVIKFGFNF
jgi:hypothetical protein